MSEEYKSDSKDSKSTILSLHKKVNELERKVVELQGASEESLKWIKLENQKIKNEIDEIFGSDDSEYQMIRQKAKRLFEIQGGATSELLSDLYQEMSRERDIPEIKDHDSIILNPDEIEHGLMNKFKSLQRSTAQRVIKMFELRSDKVDIESQTISPYIDPKSLEEANNMLEKTLTQYQSAMANADRLKEDLISKTTIIISLEQEKVSTQADLLKVKRDLDGISNESLSTKRDSEILKNEMEAMRKENNSKNIEISILQGKLENQYNRITQLIKNGEKLEYAMKEREEKVKNIEEGAEKRKLLRASDIKTAEYGYQNSNDMKSPRGTANIPDSARSTGQNYSKKTTQDFSRLDNTRSNEKNRQKVNSPLNNEKKEIVYEQTDSRSTLLAQDPNLRREQGKSNPQQIRDNNSLETSQRPLSKISTDTNNSASTIATTASRPTRYNQLSKVDEAFSEVRQNKDSIQSTENIKLNVPSPTNSQFLNEREKTVESEDLYDNPTAPSRGYRMKNPQSGNQVNDEDFTIKMKPKWELSNYDSVSPPLVSSETPEDTYFKPIIRVKVGDNGNEVIFSDVGVWTSPDLKMKNIKENSVGVQFNWENPDGDSNSHANESRGNMVYLLPYNPNNVYGLRGDSYYQNCSRTFQAQPTIPELKDSIIFRNSYMLDNKEKSIEKQNAKLKAKPNLDRIVVKNSN